MIAKRCVETIEIRKMYDRHEPASELSPVGVEEVFRVRFDSKGNAEYYKVDERKVSSYVNSFKNGCSLQSVLDRIGVLPLRDKLAALSMQPDGVSADVSSYPMDGTQAFIQLKEMREQYPDVFKRVEAGESFDTVINDVFVKSSAKNVDNTKKSDVVSDLKEGELNG